MLGADLMGFGARWAAGWLRSAARFLEGPADRAGREGGRRSYDGATTGARNDGWTALSTSANAEVGAGLVRLRDRTRELVRNNGHGKRAVNSLVSNLIGVGLTPVIDTGDEDLDRLALDVWEAWSRRCYTGSRLGFRGVQGLLARAWFTDGEVLTRFRPCFTSDMPGLPPVQLQVLEGDYLDETLTQAAALTQAASGNRIVQGVELDPLDRRVAYHLWRTHPGETYAFGGSTAYGERVRVPSDQVVHLYCEDRPGQVRGVPHLHAVMQALWDLGGYQDAERVKQRAAATLVAAVEGGAEDEEPNPDGITSTTDANGNKLTDSRGTPVETLRPGYVVYAPTGKKVHFNPTVPSQGYGENVRVSLHEVAAGAGVAYEVLTGDLSQVNFSSIRLGLNEQYRFLRALRELVFCPLALDPIWERVMAEAVAVRLLPDVPGLWRIRWSSPQIEAVDRLTDAKADLLEMRIGVRSRREIIAARGRDPDDVDAEIKKDIDRRGDLGIVLDSDPRQTTNAGIAQYIRETAGEGGLLSDLVDDETEGEDDPNKR